MSYMSEEAYWEEIEERTRPPQTMDQDHRDWHVVHGPAEKAGCPWDACLDPSWNDDPYATEFADEPAVNLSHPEREARKRQLKLAAEAAAAESDDVPF